MSIETRVAQLVEEKIADRPDLFVVDITLLPNHKLIILLDGDNGLAIDDCAKVSRHVGFHLEEENAIEDAWNLEVSSPGIDAPLKLLRQYHKNVGRQLGIKMADGTKREGKLISVGTDNIVIEESVKIQAEGQKGKKTTLVESPIALSHINEAKVLISFR
jgi:ribosome maturation factor RimP